MGRVLRRLSSLIGDPNLSKEAIAAYRNALEVRTLEGMPADWAETQNNLAIALRSLGDMTGDADRIKEGIAAYRNALEVCAPAKICLSHGL